jgi:hypothetical protein
MGDIMAENPSSEIAVKGELEQMIRRLAPEIARIFREHGTSEAEAHRVLGEVLAGFSRRWGRIVNRERWLLRTLKSSLRGEASR